MNGLILGNEPACPSNKLLIWGKGVSQSSKELGYLWNLLFILLPLVYRKP
jgi:hypothetical protein